MALVFYICLGVTIAIFIVCLILFCITQSHRYYLCPHCGYKNKPGGFAAFFARKQDVTKRLLTCPMCGYRLFMENYEDGTGPEREDTEASDETDISDN